MGKGDPSSDDNGVLIKHTLIIKRLKLLNTTKQSFPASIHSRNPTCHDRCRMADSSEYLNEKFEYNHYFLRIISNNMNNF